ncbi:glycosyltransferase family 2 protein [Candidatus Omnitrophota bacterium]
MKLTKPKVSVVMPVLNGLPYLKDSIKSILTQTFTDFELVIVNDVSTDGSTELLHEYAKKDKRIRVLQNEKNMGIVFALNRGLNESIGEYIVRMDSDDIAVKNRIEKQVAVMENDPSVAVLGAAVSYIDSLGRELNVIRYCALGNGNLTRCPLLHPTVIIRKSHLERYGLCYREKYYYAQDYFLWLEIGKVGKISAINDVVLQYRITKQAGRVRELKMIILTTLKVKKDAIFVLKIKPNLEAIGMIFMELFLLLLPARAILHLYLRLTFGKGKKINL